MLLFVFYISSSDCSYTGNFQSVVQLPRPGNMSCNKPFKCSNVIIDILLCQGSVIRVESIYLTIDFIYQFNFVGINFSVMVKFTLYAYPERSIELMAFYLVMNSHLLNTFISSLNYLILGA